MKKLGAFLVVLVVGFVAGRLSPDWASAEGTGGRGGTSPPACKDLNGDGETDMSDAIYLLQWLYLGGPEPECPINKGRSSVLPDTGQETCHDENGEEIPCDGTACPGQDGLYHSCPSRRRFIDHGDGTVTDACTGLMWQQETTPDTYAWCEGLEYCENLTLAGHDDWRLPNVRELQSVVDYSLFDPPIDPVFGTVSDWYWSSTSYAPGALYAWPVSFVTGGVGIGGKDATLYVRAVRSAP